MVWATIGASAESSVAVLRIIAGAKGLHRSIDRSQPGIIEFAEQRGLNWGQLSNEGRERLVDNVLLE